MCYPLFYDFTKLFNSPVMFCWFSGVQIWLSPKFFFGFNIGGHIFVVHTHNPIDSLGWKFMKKISAKPVLLWKIIALK
jgi:hypothetical protein